MGKKKLHHKILASINEIVAKDNVYFKPVVDTFGKGLTDQGKIDSSQYNKAIRNLCNSNHPKVELILQEILPSRLLLGISLTEKNKDGLSAMDYAEKKNPQAFALLQKSNKEELNGIINQGSSELMKDMFGFSAEPYSPVFLQPSKGLPTLPKEQEQLRKNVVKTTIDNLQSALPKMQNLHSLPAEEADKMVREFTASLISQIAPQNPVNQPVQTNLSSVEQLWEQLTIKINNDASFEPFLNDCRAGNYEAALRSLASAKDQKKSAELAYDLMQSKEQLGIDINKMLNAENQTPLHQAAIAFNQLLYYTLVGVGANSYLKDKYGKSAQDYRHDKQLGFINQTGQNPLNLMFDGNTSVNPGCTQQ